ncbi:hypothetical protein LTS18_014226, partial [Coniosporium uncinatum]
STVRFYQDDKHRGVHLSTRGAGVRQWFGERRAAWRTAHEANKGAGQGEVRLRECRQGLSTQGLL